MKYKYPLLILVTVLLLAGMSCSTTRFIEPLEKGETAVGVNAGGPIIAFADRNIPIPLSSVYIGHGYRDNLTLYGGLHTTSLLYKTLQLDFGVRKELFEGYKINPSISVAASVNGIMDFREFTPRLFPQLDLDAYWKYGGWRTYTGVQAWFDFYKASTPTYGFAGFFVPALVVGQDYKWKNWRFGVEYKRLGFNVPTENSVVNYITFGGIGAQGIYITCSKSFGYEKPEE